MKRRNFIRLSLFSACAIFAPIDVFAKSASKTLILLELDGGNDGLNTLVPFSEENYYKLRPKIAIKKEQTQVISNEFGLNENLKNIYNLYKENSCAIVQGLGYDKPNKSHFRSIQIVETASETNEYLDEGWIARSLEKFELTQIRPANAVLLGKRKKGHLFSKKLDVLHLRTIDDFIKSSSFFENEAFSIAANSGLEFLQSQEKTIKRASNSFSKYAKNISIETSFENSEISNDFKEAAKLIKSQVNIPVIKISQKGYDTHSNQKQRHSLLLKELDSAIGSFVKEMKRSNLLNEILIVSYSEFGRRVKENGSLGTDHGTASCQFVIGGRVRGGLYGKAPSLDRLHKNNLIYTTHYRSYYNTILSKWFFNRQNKFSNYEMLKFL